jgi:hypothetical protein
MRTLFRSLLPTLAAGSIALLLGGCAAADWARERLGALVMNFDLVSVDVGSLAYPSNTMEIARDLASFNTAARSKYGVNVRCRIRARNPGSFAAAFDGATARLRVKNTGNGDPATTATLPAFRVEPGGETFLDVTFPLRLDNPVFARSVWNAIVRGEDMPYRIDANLAYRLPQVPQGVPTEGSVSLDVAKGSVNARQTGATALETLLRAIEAAL